MTLYCCIFRISQFFLACSLCYPRLENYRPILLLIISYHIYKFKFSFRRCYRKLRFNRSLASNQFVGLLIAFTLFHKQNETGAFEPSLVCRRTRTRICKTLLTRPTLCYGSESWSKRITADWEKISTSRNAWHEGGLRDTFFRTVKYTKKLITTELKISQITQFVECRRYWREHADRMSSDRNPKKILNSQPKGKNKFRERSERLKCLLFYNNLPGTGLRSSNTGRDDGDHFRVFFWRWGRVTEMLAETEPLWKSLVAA
jgi:hypothetical protein